MRDDEALEPDPPPERWRDGAVEIERDHGCFRGLSWRTEIAPGAGEALRQRLAIAWQDVTRDARLIAMRTDHGDHVIVVAATGRVQVRLDLAVPPEQRAPRALELARLVHGARAAVDAG